MTADWRSPRATRLTKTGPVPAGGRRGRKSPEEGCEVEGRCTHAALTFVTIRVIFLS